MSLDLFTRSGLLSLGGSAALEVVGCIVCASGMGTLGRTLKLTNEEEN